VTSTFLFWVGVALADPVCIPDDTYQLIEQKLEELEVIETSPPQVDIHDAFTIVVDTDGRTYLNGSEEQPLSGTVSWGHVQSDIELSVVSEVYQTTPKTWGLRYRPKAHISLLPLNMRDPYYVYDLGYSADVFHIRDFNLNVSVGVRGSGIGIGYDVFPNSGVLVGARYVYPWSNQTPFQVQPSVGWYFAF
tara:strand:- start:3517 stop:4089 length:573 start_codon:yes stop_codon:yes gene_type:complete